jgi:hypothetical protein
LNHRAPNEDAAFQRILDCVADFPGHRCHQAIGRGSGASPGILQHEASGSVGIFSQAGRGAPLTEQGRLLIACDTSNDDTAQP